MEGGVVVDLVHLVHLVHSFSSSCPLLGRVYQTLRLDRWIDRVVGMSHS